MEAFRLYAHLQLVLLPKLGRLDLDLCGPRTSGTIPKVAMMRSACTSLPGEASRSFCCSCSWAAAAHFH